MLDNFHNFVAVYWLFFKINFFNKFFQEHYHGLDPDQDLHFVGPDLGPNGCKGYQLTTNVAASKKELKRLWEKFKWKFP